MSPQYNNRNKGRGGGQGGGRGRNRGGQGGGQPLCQKCIDEGRQNPNRVAKDRQFCLIHAPELTLEVDGQHGATEFEVVVRTFENDVPKNMSFSYALEGEGWKSDHTEANNPAWPNNAKVLSFLYADKERDATFIVGNDKQTITIPTKKGDKPKSKGPEVVVSVTRQRTNAQAFVQTLKDGQLESLPICYNLDRTSDFIGCQTADGTNPNEPKGTLVVPLGGHVRPRKVRVWVVGNSEPTEIAIDPNPGFGLAPITAESECLITADVSVVGNECQVLVQTYVDKVQAPAQFYYQVVGGLFQFAETHDGEVGSAFIGTKLVSIPGSPKSRRLYVGLIGKNVDVLIDGSNKKGVDLPAIPVKTHMTKPNHRKSGTSNFVAAFRGE